MRRRKRWACPGSVWAGLALGCHRSTCLSFMEKLEMGVGWMRWDNLGSHPGDTGGSSLSLPSLVEHQSGRTIVHPQWFCRGTGTATPSSAFALEAGIRQKKRGELPQQLSGAPWGISASAQAGRSRTEHERCAGRSLPWLTCSSRPQPLFFPRPWQLVPCSSCGAQSTHRECSYSSIRMNKWDCDRCAGLGTGKRR